MNRVLTSSGLAVQIALMRSMMRADEGGAFVVSNSDPDLPTPHFDINSAAEAAAQRRARKLIAKPAPATVHHETRQQRRAEERRAKKAAP